MSLVTACSHEVKQAIENAKAETDPVKSLIIIRQAKLEYQDQCFSKCFAPEEIQSAEEKYFIAAAKSGDEKVLRELFDMNKYSHLIALKIELKSKILERAQTSKNVDLLTAAASIYGNDTLSIVNKEHQIHYLKRAWSAGNGQSAGILAHIYVRMKDFENAYFWSLRCIQDCKRFVGAQVGESSDQIELIELEKHLDPSKIIKLQNESAAKTQI